MRLRKLLWIAAAITGGATLLAIADDSILSTQPSEIGSAFGSFDLSAIHQKTQSCRATADERKFDRIGWATRILDAEKLAREHNRPVFLFTHDGRISTGRC